MDGGATRRLNPNPLSSSAPSLARTNQSRFTRKPLRRLSISPRLQKLPGSNYRAMPIGLSISASIKCKPPRRKVILGLPKHKCQPAFRKARIGATGLESMFLDFGVSCCGSDAHFSGFRRINELFARVEIFWSVRVGATQNLIQSSGFNEEAF
ncbi:hypothetical protein AAHA92_24165 [Salvia divinorum]|uniref:Uncharacterized protein n=1 Tax=Salvia divinorum TaxID=28513 RepID=A0ABD1G6K1_SALDI